MYTQISTLSEDQAMENIGIENLTQKKPTSKAPEKDHSYYRNKREERDLGALREITQKK